MDETNKLKSMLPAVAGGFMAVPRFAKLLLALFRDARVPRFLKIMTAAAILYIALPIDIIPDFIPIAGWVDQIVVIFLILIQYMRYCPPDVFKEHWDNTMGADFTLESDLIKTVERYEPVVGAKYESIHRTITGLSAKISEYSLRKQQEAEEIPQQ